MTQILMMGLPDTGKSTFLAALWHVVQGVEVPGSLVLDRLPEGNREYIGSLHDRWLRCEPVGRTPAPLQQPLSMELRRPEDGRVITIRIPDLAGEVFENHWRDRRWAAEYGRLVGGTQGILLFLHADHKHKPVATWDFVRTLRTIEGESKEENPYEPDKACAQAKVVDILQVHLQKFPGPRPFKVAVIVSAWDVMERISSTPGEAVTPVSYLVREAPLLYQFLAANGEAILHRVYGVSAQGGDLEEEKAQLQAEDTPSNRIRVVSDGQSTHDITAPLRWLVE